MADSMRERVAQAICKSERSGFGCYAALHAGGSVNNCGCGNGEDLAAKAVAAIAAMREPTDAMLTAGWPVPSAAPGSVWKAMIDAALAE